ncbi:MAG: hypothetical protein CMK99_12735 [Pseudomonas sp.]|nr:hypothetical protein [Pseudomonas sp.]HBS77789.1 hypothetical protein [Pseudomonas sp.]|tara:strand:+ start:13453 stop:13977 length:525 start_codon:yes stop_codon:yes gene_type:complete
MNDTTQPTYEELAAELATLRGLKEELHGNLTKARARIKELEQTAEQQQTELLEVKLNRPVAGLLEGILVGSKYAAQELADHIKFELNEDGQIELRDLEGNPATITEKADGKEITRPVRFEQQDVRRFLCNTGKFDHIIRASGITGGGAPNTYASSHKAAEPKQEARSSASFGLK